jgi:hypothetical protein
VESGQTFGSISSVLTEKQAYKVARNLLKDYALQCIAEEVKRRNLSHSLGQKVQTETFREIRNQTEDFATHWAQFPVRGLVRVKDLEGYVKRKLVAAGDFKDLRKKLMSNFMIVLNRILAMQAPHAATSTSPIRNVNATSTIPRHSEHI